MGLDAEVLNAVAKLAPASLVLLVLAFLAHRVIDRGIELKIPPKNRRGRQ